MIVACSYVLLLFVERRIDSIHVTLVHFVHHEAHEFAEALEMYNLALPQEADNVDHVRIVRHAQDVVIGNPGLLLWCDWIKTT